MGSFDARFCSFSRLRIIAAMIAGSRKDGDGSDVFLRGIGGRSPSGMTDNVDMDGLGGIKDDVDDVDAAEKATEETDARLVSKVGTEGMDVSKPPPLRRDDRCERVGFTGTLL